MNHKTLFILFTLLYLFFIQVYAQSETEILELPQLIALDLQGELLKVTATTSIIADVVANVGGDAIELTTLMEAGQDPHSYEATAQDLTKVSQADVVFVNGWNLEESLISILEETSSAPITAISANITPLEFGGEHEHHDDDEEHGDEHGDEHEGNEHGAEEEHHDEGEEHSDEHEEEHKDEEHAEGEHSDDHGEEHEHHHHEGADPHVWFSVTNVMQWVKNVEQVLSSLDPNNASLYASNANAYLIEQETLKTSVETSLGVIPEEQRFIVSNHDTFTYFANDYGFEVIGTIIPANSTLAEPSAADLVELIEELEFHNLCTLFTETTISDKLAQTVAGELSHCENVQVLSLYTGALGPAGSGADSYIGMFQSNVDAFVQGLVN